MLCKDIKSSYLKTPLNILKKESKVDEFGIDSLQYTESPIIKGFLKNSTYKKLEFLKSQGINAIDYKELIIRFMDLKDSDKVLINKVKFDILDIENIEEKDRYLSVTIGRVTNG